MAGPLIRGPPLLPFSSRRRVGASVAAQRLRLCSPATGREPAKLRLGLGPPAADEVGLGRLPEQQAFFASWHSGKERPRRREPPAEGWWLLARQPAGRPSASGRPRLCSMVFRFRCIALAGPWPSFASALAGAPSAAQPGLGLSHSRWWIFTKAATRQAARKPAGLQRRSSRLAFADEVSHRWAGGWPGRGSPSLPSRHPGKGAPQRWPSRLR
uniref:Uncharacterized protein n=1 Tax=Sphaerodactylus townsendi TaxID=933632 RepID=A0ACB8E6M0_9SAUR